MSTHAAKYSRGYDVVEPHLLVLNLVRDTLGLLGYYFTYCCEDRSRVTRESLQREQKFLDDVPSPGAVSTVTHVQHPRVCERSVLLYDHVEGTERGRVEEGKRVDEPHRVRVRLQHAQALGHQPRHDVLARDEEDGPKVVGLPLAHNPRGLPRRPHAGAVGHNPVHRITDQGGRGVYEGRLHALRTQLQQGANRVRQPPFVGREQYQFALNRPAEQRTPHGRVLHVAARKVRPR
eukprot:CAMPEP_0180053412 /NCGR_PEP_ID=MMETSP0985-20121206/2259_1 /TAXON_ID=483367 /ORGANISM="non described non described, Strain CCMP 2436" /LENGTH=233 /DNA_ID=CAMNT_0021982895 /DNA_START=1274 /DNA_END=1976 /DNA_ORIENTATION=-